MSKIINALLALLTLIYPFAIYFGLDYFGVRSAALLLISLLGLRLFFTAKRNNSTSAKIIFAVMLVFTVVIFSLESSLGLKFYPVLINIILLGTFAYTLTTPASMIERFARLTEPNLSADGVAYTRKVTMVWCLFFFLNSLVSAYTALFMPLKAWSLYNGFIAYIFIGIIFVVEYIVRFIVKRNRAKHEAKQP